MSGFDRLGHVFFGDLFHLAFHHHYGIRRGADDHVDIRFQKLGAGGVDDEFPVYAAHADLGDGRFERKVRKLDGSGGRQPCHGVGHHVLVVGHQLDHHLGFRVIIFREKGPQYAVYQAHYQDFPIAGARLALKEAAGIAPGSVKFFAASSSSSRCFNKAS